VNAVSADVDEAALRGQRLFNAVRNVQRKNDESRDYDDANRNDT